MSISFFRIFSALGHMLAKLLNLGHHNMIQQFIKLSYQLLNGSID